MFQRKTVASVLSDFQKTIDDLYNINEQECIKANEMTAKIAELELARQASLNESQNAVKVAAKLRDLISA